MSTVTLDRTDATASAGPWDLDYRTGSASDASTPSINFLVVLEPSGLQLPIRVEHVDGGLLAIDTLTDQWGVGSDVRSAVGELLDTMAHYREDLIARENHLTPRLARHLRLLRPMFIENAVI